jgi:hypothetical protein
MLQSFFVPDQVRQRWITSASAVRFWAEVVLNPSDKISTRFAVLRPTDQQDQNGCGAIRHHRRNWHESEQHAMDVVADESHDDCPGDH